MAAAPVVTGYDPASMQVLSAETSSTDQAIPSDSEYLEDMVKIWKRKQAKVKPASCKKTPQLDANPQLLKAHRAVPPMARPRLLLRRRRSNPSGVRASLLALLETTTSSS
ncbi:hypothetical protein HPB50_004276 [Hyalomma asiaticum]|uniref:Uncharacterized protein n=1 Tax=Hyalomma asiaticum TaxID=266040 RepID=A0ACB7TCT3_HYAAI|nr:hypothetical protein HPB50_004276 [Hyalomma asiaticum]